MAQQDLYTTAVCHLKYSMTIRVALQNLEVKNFREGQDKSESKAQTKLNGL
jgi:hypothetical protein